VAKLGIYVLTRSLALQFGEYGIRVDTLSMDKAGSPARHTAEPASRMRESLAGRACPPRDVASAVALMIADQTVLAAAAGLLADSGARSA
jgi:NAD(P)-dependent dehydrogenase (short-subunit alcohol dehydrogenase family)